MAAKKFIKSAIKHPGAFTAQAKRAGMTPAQFQAKVLAHPSSYSATTVRRAHLRQTLVGLGH